MCSNPRSALCLCQALLVTAPGHGEALARVWHQHGERRSAIRLVLARVLDLSRRETETSFVLQHSRCVQTLVNRLHVLMERTAELPDTEPMVEQIESYCWTFIGHAADSVRNNVRNALAKVAAALGPFPGQLRALISRLDAIRWGDKRKLLALLAVARGTGAAPLTRHIEGLAVDVLRVMVSDATVAGLCHDLYETLTRSALLNGRGDTARWIRDWIEPLFKMTGECSELNRLRMTAMRMDDAVIAYATELESEESFLSGEEFDTRVKIGLLGLKIVKQRTVNSKEYLDKECFKKALTSYSDEVSPSNFIIPTEALSCSM